MTEREFAETRRDRGLAQVRRLVGEETALLTVPREHRRQEQRERERAVSNELDRIWASLRERAERLGLDSQ
jgi:hypothetical protein